ncbi:hypothetical protein [Lysobacter sp. A3-1-A15]|uniref:hypothetical protein n=1 Tax=Novilysobacter viscosus TaxID=3098602 RepID=UPI002ED94A41
MPASLTRSTGTRRPKHGVGGMSWALLAVAVFGFAAVWVLLGSYSGRQYSWMALLAALDVAWVLRLGGWRPGVGRLALGVTGTGLAIVVANWWLIAAHLGAMLGLQPWESASKLGHNLAWTLAQLANGTADLAWIAAALVLAAVASR